jgi:hypothetical protein
MSDNEKVKPKTDTTTVPGFLCSRWSDCCLGVLSAWRLASPLVTNCSLRLVLVCGLCVPGLGKRKKKNKKTENEKEAEEKERKNKRWKDQ